MEEGQQEQVIEEKKPEPMLDKEQKLKKELMEFYQEQIRKEDIEINKIKGKLRIHNAKRKRYIFERTKFSGKGTNKKRKTNDAKTIPDRN